LVAAWSFKKNIMSIGKRIKELRGKVPRDVFATQLGVVRNTVQRYEIYEQKPSLEFIEIICNKFDVNPDWLIFGKGEKYRGDIHKQESSPLNLEVLVDAIETIEQILHDKKKAMAPANKAEIIAKIYEYYLDEEPGKSKEKIYNLLKLVA
jgi:transcriptional regulator with XRE-family HTH domain